MGKSFEHVNSTERKLIVNMKEAGLTWAKIQEITQRSSKTIDKVLREAKKPLSTGVTAVKNQSAAKASKNKKTLLSVLDNPRLPTRGSLPGELQGARSRHGHVAEGGQRAKGGHDGHGEGEGPGYCQCTSVP